VRVLNLVSGPYGEVIGRWLAAGGADVQSLAVTDLDWVVIGPQKALAGPAGVSAVVTGPQGWARMDANPVAPRNSILSLLDWKRNWIDAGRATLPVICHQLEMREMD